MWYVNYILIKLLKSKGIVRDFIIFLALWEKNSSHSIYTFCVISGHLVHVFRNMWFTEIMDYAWFATSSPPPPNNYTILAPHQPWMSLLYLFQSLEQGILNWIQGALPEDSQCVHHKYAPSERTWERNQISLGGVREELHKESSWAGFGPAPSQPSSSNPTLSHLWGCA